MAASKERPDPRLNRNRLFTVDPSLHGGVRVEDLRVPLAPAAIRGSGSDDRERAGEDQA